MPSVKHLRVYGSKVYVSLGKREKNWKMGETKWEGVVVGYPSSNVGYRVGQLGPAKGAGSDWRGRTKWGGGIGDTGTCRG